jgi:hypothetical protein
MTTCHCPRCGIDLTYFPHGCQRGCPRLTNEQAGRWSLAWEQQEADTLAREMRRALEDAR